MMESEDSCVYCSKSLMGLNSFNKRMHIETCKVRKIVDDNPNKSHLELDEIMVIGDNCSYCFKSFKDFKSEFNKRLHVKCCKIKKETNEEKQHMKCQTKGESCLFCTKPLDNLNEFNKRMHVENCKIRKSLEGANSSSKKEAASAATPASQQGVIELGDNCGYCGKSFVNLSQFNKRLHFDHCKLKKRKLNDYGSSQHQQQQHHEPGMAMVTTISLSNSSTPIHHAVGAATLTNGSGGNVNHQNNYASLSMGPITYDLGETCVFCSRSLKNLSNFNKRIHIETCKVKKFKIATAKLRQEARKTARKNSGGGNGGTGVCVAKKEKESTINFIPNNQMQVANNKVLPMAQVVSLSQMTPMMHIGQLNGIQNTNDNTNVLNATIATLTSQNQYAANSNNNNNNNNATFVQQQQQQQTNNIYI